MTRRSCRLMRTSGIQQAQQLAAHADLLAIGLGGGQAALRRLMPDFPGATPRVPVADRMVVEGLPMNLAAFETPRDAASVLEFYAAHFRRQGWSYVGTKDAKKYVPYPALSATWMEEDLQLQQTAAEEEVAE